MSKYTTMFAALIVIVVAVSFFVYSLVKEDPQQLEEILVEDVDGVTQLNPGPGMATPTSEPNITQPTSPPQEN